MLEQIDPWLAIHLAGAVIAVGAVTVTDGFLIASHLRPTFAKVLVRVSALLSMIVWIGLFLLSVSGLVFLLQGRVTLGDPMFRLKMVLTAAVFLNGIVLNSYVTPRFHALSEHEVHDLPDRFQRIAGVSAAISLLGWWSILFIAYFLV